MQSPDTVRLVTDSRTVEIGSLAAQAERPAVENRAKALAFTFSIARFRRFCQERIIELFSHTEYTHV